MTPHARAGKILAHWLEVTSAGLRAYLASEIEEAEDDMMDPSYMKERLREERREAYEQAARIAENSHTADPSVVAEAIREHARQVK